MEQDNELLVFPAGYVELQSINKETDGFCTLGKRCLSAQCFVQSYSMRVAVDENWTDDAAVRTCFRAAMNRDEALIEAQCGVTRLGYPCKYGIVKAKNKLGGVNYFLLLEVLCGDAVSVVRGFFSQLSLAGMRERIVRELLCRDGVLTEENEGWMRDPYDASLEAPFQMNLSEQATYDKAFPDHPLTLCRDFVRHQIEG